MFRPESLTDAKGARVDVVKVHSTWEKEEEPSTTWSYKQSFSRNKLEERQFYSRIFRVNK